MGPLWWWWGGAFCFVLAIPVTCGHSWARDQKHAIAVTRVTTVATSILYPQCHKETLREMFLKCRFLRSDSAESELLKVDPGNLHFFKFPPVIQKHCKICKLIQ